MALKLRTNQSLTGTAFPLSGPPFCVLMWMRPAQTAATRGFWSAGTSNTNKWELQHGTSFLVTARNTSDLPGSAAGVFTTGAWTFCCARYIANDNRWASAISSTGALVHGQNTTSQTPTGTTHHIGTTGFGAGSTLDGDIAEYYLIEGDVQSDPGQISNSLLRQLAYNGAWSVPGLRRSIIEYRSFRTHHLVGPRSEVYFGRYGQRSFTGVNTPTITDHPPHTMPWSRIYVRPGARAISRVTYVPDVVVNTGAGTVNITGTTTVGQTLTAVFNDDDPDGAASNITYQWERSGTPIGGATSSTYLLDALDEGETITVVVDYEDAQGFSESIESSPTAAISAAGTGIGSEGITLTITYGGITLFSGIVHPTGGISG